MSKGYQYEAFTSRTVHEIEVKAFYFYITFLYLSMNSRTKRLANKHLLWVIM